MSVRGFSPGRRVEVPRGQWASLLNRKTGTPARATAAQNVRFRYGTVRSRPGTSAVFATTGKVTSLFNWITPSGDNLVLYQDDAEIKSYKQVGAVVTTLLPVPPTTRSISYAPLDVWTYMCGSDTAGNGTFQTEIFDGVNVDKAFRGVPVITGWTAADGGPGQCTMGTHYFGFVYQNRTGYSGVPVTNINYAITATTTQSFAVTATSNANPDVISLPGHTFVNGQTVTGTGATGDTAINGVFLVTNAIAGISLQLTNLLGVAVAGNGAYTGGGRLTAPDVVTAPGNNVQVGQQIVISGSTGDTAINGSVVVASVAGATFTLTDSSGNPIISNGAYAGGGIVTNGIVFTTSAGLRKINVSVSLPAEPDGGTDANGGVQATLFLIATRADNTNIFYFMPTDAQTGQIGEQPVPYNTPVTLNFVMSLSDEDIAASLAGDTAQANFLFLAQDGNGNGPFNPNFVVAYGQRMCYGTGTVLYVSDINNPQQIAADTNQVRMQNQRAIAFAFPLPGNTALFVTGDKWTGYVTDNSDTPSTWAEPLGVSDSLGAPFANCVCANTGGPWVWIVTESGPYLFDGSYEGLPMTYLSSGIDEDNNPIGWSRVNWNAAYAIQIKDDVRTFKFYVAVPLDGSTECNYMFCIDYRNGKTFDSCDISLDNFNPVFFSSIGDVKEVSTGESNLWIGPSAAGNVTRLDPATHNDQGKAIFGFWQSGEMRGPNIVTSMIRVGYLDLWIKGHAPLVNGVPTLGITVISLDNKFVVEPFLQTNMGEPAALVEKPGSFYSAKLDLSQINDYVVGVGTNSVDAFFELSAVVCYERADLSNR